MGAYGFRILRLRKICDYPFATGNLLRKEDIILDEICYDGVTNEEIYK